MLRCHNLTVGDGIKHYKSGESGSSNLTPDLFTSAYNLKLDSFDLILCKYVPVFFPSAVLSHVMSSRFQITSKGSALFLFIVLQIMVKFVVVGYTNTWLLVILRSYQFISKKFMIQ